jgi:DNA gyrase subunit B
LKTILDHLRQQAYLTPGIKITIKDKRKIEKKIGEPLSYVFYFEDGIVAFLKHIIRGKKQEHQNPFYISQKYEGDILVEVAFNYTKDFETRELSFANNIYTPEGGTHLTGFRAALTKTINKYAKENNFFNSKENIILTREDVEEGLAVIVSIKLREPQFEGQTKAKLGNPEARTAVENVVSEGLYNYFKNNPTDASLIIQKCLLTQKARIKAKAVKETILRKGVLSGLMLPGKLTDCASRNPEESEIFIVEGDSAGGSARQGRNPKFQAILPLRGKILNVEKARLSKMLESKEIKALIVALGTAIAEEFDIEKLRYHKIILMSDADVDGLHIQTLLLTLFYRYFRPLIERGHLYIAQPPLYRISKGKEIFYAFSDEQKDQILKKINSPNVDIQRYKGLGEMNPEQLWETTMDPQTRILHQVTIEDAEYADKMFDILMGDEVLPRKKFIETHAKDVKNLDI